MKGKKVLLVAIILSLVMILTSCLGLLGGILGGVDTFFSFVDSFGVESLPEDVVYGSENNLAVGFDRGELVAFWDYDDTYIYKLEITKDGEKAVFEETDAESGIHFSEGQFDLENAGYNYGDNLQLSLFPGQEETFNFSYQYDYEGLTKSEYDAYTQYAGSGFDMIDCYIASRYEFFEYFSFLIIFRPGASLTKDKNETYYMLDQVAYIGYDFMDLYSDTTIEQAFDSEMACVISSFEDSASYSYAYGIEDDIATFKLKFSYEMDPSSSTQTYTSYTNEVRPIERAHYRVGEQNERNFAIDARTRSVQVTSSDQLYYAIKKGYKPDCVVGSNAYHLYQRMRFILSYLNEDNTLAPTKVHYIYDYLVNSVLYDYEFVSVVLKSNAAVESRYFTYNCLYMEGVFGFENNAFNLNKRVAICDGLSKAFLCMAQIEGIDTIKVSGTVNGDAHAWNKVLIGSKWYMVDITWGNVLEGQKEYLSHDYLMTKDDSRHVEDKWFYYPVATGQYYFSFN